MWSYSRTNLFSSPTERKDTKLREVSVHSRASAVLLCSSSDIRTVTQGSTVHAVYTPLYILQLFQKFLVSGISLYFPICCKVWSCLCSVGPKRCQPLCTFPQSASVRREALYSWEVRREALYSWEAEAQRDEGRCGRSPRRSLGKEETSLEIWFQDCLKCQKRCPWYYLPHALSQLLSLVDTSSCMGMWWVRSSHWSIWKLFLCGFSGVSFQCWHQGKIWESWEFGRLVWGPWLCTSTGREVILLDTWVPALTLVL